MVKWLTQHQNNLKIFRFVKKCMSLFCRLQPNRSSPVAMPNARPAYRRLHNNGGTGSTSPLPATAFLIEAG